MNSFAVDVTQMGKDMIKVQLKCIRSLSDTLKRKNTMINTCCKCVEFVP